MSIRLHRVKMEKLFSKTIKLMQLRAVKRMNFKFDPFHPNVRSIRDAMFHLNGEKVRLTNPACVIKTEVVCDRSQPTIDVLLNEGQRYRLLTENLTSLEIVQQIDKICREFDPKPAEEPAV